VLRASLLRVSDPIRAAIAEFVGTALLLAAIVGSGIMGVRLSDGNIAIALLANSVATGAVLTALILAFGPISGAHFNPVVSVSQAWMGRMSRSDLAAYIPAQLSGAVAGVLVAHGMFGERLIAWSLHQRSGLAQLFAELVATFGLICVISGTAHARDRMVPFAVGAYIAAAYWFTASTSFANPAVTIARAMTNTFTGIRPVDVPGFVLAQLVGGLCGTWLFRWFFKSET
jgi:glycerol uptake facilitator-like aquaporin